MSSGSSPEAATTGPRTIGDRGRRTPAPAHSIFPLVSGGSAKLSLAEAQNVWPAMANSTRKKCSFMFVIENSGGVCFGRRDGFKKLPIGTCRKCYCEGCVMRQYRVYFLDEGAHIFAPSVVLECADDDEAVRQAKQYIDGKDIELRRGDYRVAKFPRRGGEL